MRIVRPYANLITHSTREQGIQAMKQIEWAARISHRSEDDQKMDSWERFIQAVVMKKGDWSVTEHVIASVDFYVDRGVTHELVRHRIASYTQESTRFVNYEKKMPPSFIYPKPGEECPYCINATETGIEELEARYEDDNWVHDLGDDWAECTHNSTWMFAMQNAEKEYKGLLADGWRPQEARSVFPNALASRIVATLNLRSWRHVFMMRTTKEAHPQMRQVMIPLLEQFQKTFPILYDDIVPNMSQAESLAKPK